MKFDVNSSLYLNSLWQSQEGRQILTYLIRDVVEDSIDPAYYPTAFDVSGDIVPTAPDGTASFTVKAEYPEHATIMDLRAPLGEGRLAAEGEEAKYSGSIPDFIAPVWKETAAERKYKLDLFAELGDDAPLLKGYATNVLTPRIKSGIMALDYMALRAETTGKVVYDKGVGNKLAVYKADIPAANFHKAGAKVWTDPDCRLLDQMVAIEQEYKDLWGVDFARQWKVTKAMFQNVIMKNAQVIETIKMNWLLDKGITTEAASNVSNFVVTEENFNRYVVAAIDGLSPIRVIDAKQYDNGVVVDPWQTGVAVLCPAGYAGKILRTDILDVKMYADGMTNNLVSVNSATTSDGLMTVINYTLPNGMLREWQTKVVMSACPVLTDFLYRVIVDTTTAS